MSGTLSMMIKAIAKKHPALKRIVEQRDWFIAENGLLAAENNRLIAESKFAQSVRWLRHRPVENFNLQLSIGKGTTIDDGRIVGRLIESYRKFSFQESEKESSWSALFDAHHVRIHEAFMNGSIREVSEILSNPASNNIFFGFDELTLAYIDVFKSNPKTLLDMCQDDLFRLGEAIGELPLSNPEAEAVVCDTSKPTDELIFSIEKGLGIKLEFPDIYPDTIGLLSSRGTVTYRAIQALYLAFRLENTLKSIGKNGGSVCEIGAGLGRSAFYANKMGLKNYTLVDIPITLMAQGYFLMRSLGEDAVVLPGETSPSRNKIRLMHSEDFFASSESYDLIANVDSLTELGPKLAARYLQSISRKTSTFLSINHEVNSSRVNKLLDREELGEFNISRYPYWMRNGYAEELISFKP